ncbi:MULTISPECIES: UDP-glucose 4-epimerase GalE [Plesiomonas]|jgi:UDP-glucose 4-epimerase|uniref:UDP-glucose 4-epimerase n=2 Tax=Plesiomonas shigelloides TaxID=703 RepID=R8ANS8_PLESH|nr:MULTISPECIES: UDP-glucose 4-epimerase GalE [Plesiomonas]EON87994.1 UDP-glucose 4-epimerase/UDP-N-acetylglucosamine 4-epimerase [Plesiomonas shigelloides 302-73]KAB7660712.1 UDP-glucose 4-epimerase GalE [Plesiomonas shigelloides]KAB7673966.1 UDP-glucose 4-epimerase GalE [Plesiomonas shigelloides]KAB7687991.1 UDP-glucose 4-epimerase GalE [Plesiomonas shigelloides]KAB7702549.1 UDP-glucose 4-epimerase GalE [Plesiomonas shigelloides]
MAILVTGGAGYIGSHTVLELLNSGNDVVVIDNLCNSSRESLRRVEALTGRSVTFYEADVCDRSALQTIFAQHAIDAVIHFAGLKAVGESTQIPLKYYQNNIAATLVLCEEMERAGVFRLVFSSSATVYGDPHTVPIQEHFPTSATNPYGRSKLMVEEMLRDIVAADPRWSVVLLRYFNPVGAHISGQIGEDPNGIPNNLLPYIAQVAIGRLKQLSVFGNDYPTPDGTGVRDYIHVVDLSLGHLKALQYIADRHGVFTFNLGTGQGYSVLEMVKAFEQASGRAVPYQVVARRPGDIAVCYAEPDLAAQELGWRAERGLPEMMADTWRWQSQNPNGYKD